MAVLKQIAAPYTAFDSWAYDFAIAPAIMRFQTSINDILLPIVPTDGRLLDVGCGGGQMALHLGTLCPALQIAGIDLAADQVARARKRTRQLGDRAQITEGSVLALPYDDAQFDAVLSIASIKHWSDQARGIAECVRVLKPGGTLAIVEADRSCRIEDARDFIGCWRIPPPLRPIALMVFRTYIAGQSIDLADATALLEPLPLAHREVRRIANTPGLMMLGRKA